MNWSKNYQGQAKLAWYVLPTFKVNLEGLYSKAEWQDYDHGLNLNPDGNVFKFSDSYNSVLTLTHTLSSRTFYTLNASYFYKEFNQYRYEDPYDPRHYFVPDSLLPEVNNLAFSTIGMNLGRFWRETETISAKMDFTSQINMSNLIKFGFEAKKHRLGVDGYSLQKLRVDGIEVVPFQPDVPDVSSPARNVFEREPFEFSAYAQDKIELDEVIINVGLRLDYFNSNADVLLDTSDPNINIPLRIDQGLDELSLDERRPYFYKKADPKWQVSPRLGIAYPISTTGVIHFSYGHFLQIPSFQYLYNNSDYKVPETGSGGVYGNPNLNPQRTVMYEIGLRQEFGNDYLVEVTGFYRDVRDWISTQQYLTKNGVLYALYENKDYSNVKGVTLTLKKRFSQSFAFDVNYTFQFAEGSNSSPEEEFYNSRSNNEPTLFLLPMDWDQRHLLNVSLMVGGEDWGSTILGRIGSGLPYTPQITQYTSDRGISSGLQKNSRSRPIQYTFDVNLYKMFRVADYDLKAFMKIFNLFDTKNVVNVFGDTGQPDYTTQYANVAEDVRRPNSIAEYTTYPWHYSAPRKVQVGVEWSF
jgi:outer membrane receptor protein involved in Fe transport